MWARRWSQVIYMLFGIAISMLLLSFSGYWSLCTTHDARGKAVDDTMSYSVIERIQPVNDNEILTAANVDVGYLKKLYLQKMAYLVQNKMIKSMGKRHNCTSKLLALKPGIWCHDLNCTRRLAPVGSMDMFKSIAKPIRAVQSNAFRRIQEAFETVGLQRKKFVFLMAVSENHYLESMATVQSLHEKVFPNINNFTFYVYDMGITAKQKRMLQTYGKATVRTYPFHMLPARIHLLKTYTWKPVLIQAHIDVGEIVVYMDASVRIVKDLVPLCETARITGFLMAPGSHSLAQQTSHNMFAYFGDQACSYSSYVEFEGAFLIFHNEEFSRKLLLEPWVACALDPLCMSENMKSFGSRNVEYANVRKYGTRHRFDLSAMTILLVKLFRDDMYTFAIPRRFHYVKQGRTNVTDYLEQLRKQNKHV